MSTLETDGRTFRYAAMGTSWAVTIWDDIRDARFASLSDEIHRKSAEFERTYSRFLPDSFITRISTETGIIEVPPDLVPMLRLYRSLYVPSGKKLNPLIGNTISDLGYDASYSLKEKGVIRPTPDFIETLRIVDDRHIEMREAACIDLGALGKGYFVDRIAEYLIGEELGDFLVDGSGDIRYRRNTGIIRAGMEDPDDPQKAIGVLELTGEGALCASSGSRRAWGTHTHTIDPQSFLSPKDVLATWVRAESATLADALATCLFFSPERDFRPAHDFECAVMRTGRQVSLTPGFGARVFVG